MVEQVQLGFRQPVRSDWFVMYSSVYSNTMLPTDGFRRASKYSRGPVQLFTRSHGKGDDIAGAPIDVTIAERKKARADFRHQHPGAWRPAVRARRRMLGFSREPLHMSNRLLSRQDIDNLFPTAGPELETVEATLERAEADEPTPEVQCSVSVPPPPPLSLALPPQPVLPSTSRPARSRNPPVRLNDYI